MTGFDAERAAIEGHIQAGFGAAPLRFENAPFTPPQDRPYATVAIRHGAVRAVSLGPAPLLRIEGAVEVALRAPEGSGTAPLRVLADAVSALLRRQALSAGAAGMIRFGEAEIGAVTVEDDWRRLDVTVSFRREVVAAAP